MILVQNGDHFTTSKSATFFTDSDIHVFGSFDFDCGEHIVLETFDDTLATNSRPGEMADCCVFLGPQGALRNDIAARVGADGLAAAQIAFPDMNVQVWEAK